MICVDPGNIADRGHEEYYESTPYRLPESSTVQVIEWQAEVPDKTWVKAQLRWADSEATIEDAAWLGPDGSDSWYENGDSLRPNTSGMRWLQYRLALGAINSLRSPRISAVSISHGG